MSRARHKMMSGGTPKPYNAEGSNVLKEAEEKAKGGKVKRARGGEVSGVAERARGGRLDRPGRKRGGGVGSDMRPLSSASRTKDAMGHSGDTGTAGEDQED